MAPGKLSQNSADHQKMWKPRKRFVCGPDAFKSVFKSYMHGSNKYNLVLTLLVYFYCCYSVPKSCSYSSWSHGLAPLQTPLSVVFPRQEYWVGWVSSSSRWSLTQGSDPRPCIVRRILLLLSHLGSVYTFRVSLRIFHPVFHCYCFLVMDLPHNMSSAYHKCL